MIVLSDEIYAQLIFDGDFCPTAKVYPERTIIMTGFSKWGSSGGWRLGYAYFPEELEDFRKALVASAGQSHSCAPAPIQFAWAKALRDEHEQIDAYVRDCRTILKTVARFCE
ncbi:unnamed protein product, partial [Notodromas monacha]